ncbi:bifunctional folylpolyglutamate synthase/dihydrofolate synthase [Streptococcus moroccensis]|uniref:Dihydrofolate synthase/folylpolyglutamate synthase n=1 Tax=Streptococcus moroccensis TaxID=1451356 RepID=A0ABT9YU60_9STRE|nr:folylpolyglutamate synthase/dihydrofolate synthase family protein [Streptococcus moroccensis]MDQ0223526.1 dihydrofolate synthase/folylpolyglutamate synthase [Streptococcus moroccensis]
MNQPKTYEDCLEWIHGKLKFGIKPGLKRMTWMLEQLDNPQHKIRAVHIVGTNGKGSTVANLQRIFTGSSYRVGSFTSPFIIDFRERISIDGEMISKEELIALVEAVYSIVERLPKETGHEPATEFEIITVMMFYYFAEINPVDIVLVEAGLGGRLDSTNVFTPLLTLCPSIGLDHQAILGETHEAIAREKAGAIKPGVPFIFATDKESVRAVFKEIAHHLKAPLYEAGQQFSLSNGIYHDEVGYAIEDISVGLPGAHQISNASLAIKASLLLKETFPKVTETTIRNGLAQTKWVGRTELIAPNLMIDGAHNDESVKALCDLLASRYENKLIHILFAAIEGKPVNSMLEQLGALGQVTVTTFDYPKALPVEAYPKEWPREADYRNWLAHWEFSSSDDFYLITGSLYFISEIRAILIPHDRY